MANLDWDFKTLQEKVRLLAEAGYSKSQIAHLLEIPDVELDEKYFYESNLALAQRNVNIANLVYETAIAGNLTAAQFWLNRIGGWENKFKDTSSQYEREYTKIELVVIDKKPEEGQE